jgi:aspartyl-tRNA(Asn)/glutamyl-tRNA(Gln) amidotransferase subunit A
MEIDKLTLTEYVAAVKEKRFSALHGIEFFFGKIKHDNHNAVIEVFPSALDRAKEIDAKIASGKPLGRLAGAPIIIKDNILYRGHKATAASKMLENFTAPYTATIVEKMLAEDAVLIGRANCDEYAMGTTGETSVYGPALNAHSLKHVAGGSSSGSAAAVGANLCAAAVGTDTGGSVRCPAAWNGLYAIKPTYGTVSRYGIIAFASSFDQAGPICKTAEDTELLLSVMQGKDKLDGTTFASAPLCMPEVKLNGKEFDIKDLRIGFVKEVWQHRDTIEDFEKYQKIFDDFRQKGANVIPVSIKNSDLALPAYYIIAPAEAASNLARFDGVKYTSAPDSAENIDRLYKKSRTENFGTEVKRRIMLGNYVLSSGYFDAYYGKAKKIQSALKNEFAEVFRKCDCIIMPVTPCDAPKIGALTDPVSLYLIDFFSVVANVTGLPSLCVPFETGKQGLPIGFQILGRHFDEPLLFKIAEVCNGK